DRRGPPGCGSGTEQVQLGLVFGQVYAGVQVEGAGPGQRLVHDEVEALAQVRLDRSVGGQAELIDQLAQPVAGAVQQRGQATQTTVLGGERVELWTVDVLFQLVVG